MTSDFRKLISARFLFTFAVQMQAVVLGWRIYEIVGDPLALGFIGQTEAVPAIGLVRELFNTLRAGDVRAHGKNLTARLAHLPLDGLQRVGLDIRQHDLHSLGREGVGQRAPDAARRTRDDSHPPR